MNSRVYSLLISYLEEGSSMRKNITGKYISESKNKMYFPRKYKPIKFSLVKSLNYSVMSYGLFCQEQCNDNSLERL